MKMTFRHYGESDPVTLSDIRQIPAVTGIVTALYGIPVGEVWPTEDILAAKRRCEAAGLSMEVNESVPVHEDIKRGEKTREKLTENYIQTIRNLAATGVKVICYNFMPVFDWVRTDLHFSLPDGGTALAYDSERLAALDPKTLSLPGWDESYTKEELAGLLGQYKGMTEDDLFENMVWFLEKLMPVCEECDVRMAVHPDDPPWPLFGLPRIVSTEKQIDRLLSTVNSPYNGLTFCTGSLGAGRTNDLVSMAEKYARMGRIHFVHARNIRYDGDGASFHECPHPTACGSLDIYGILRALRSGGFDGYIRPDHGRNIWGENGRPGYGLYDRALGAMYLSGLWEGIVKTEKAHNL